MVFAKKMERRKLVGNCKKYTRKYMTTGRDPFSRFVKNHVTYTDFYNDDFYNDDFDNDDILQ